MFNKINAFKRCISVCDPVMGDKGELVGKRLILLSVQISCQISLLIPHLRQRYTACKVCSVANNKIIIKFDNL